MVEKGASAPRQTTAEILVVGNELLNGTTLDTNSHWLCKRLDGLGVMVRRKTTVRDEVAVIAKSFRDCISRRPDWVISVGGLGPTFDDMTIEGLSFALRRRLVLDSVAQSMLKASYARRARFLGTMPRRISKSSLKMAQIPDGSRPLANPVGSAPAVLAKSGETKIVSLPGVPSEMKAIFDQEILPIFKKTVNYSISEEWLRVVGISESRLAPKINRIADHYSPLVYIKSHPKGFAHGKSVLNIQLRSAGVKKDAGNTEKVLKKASSEVIIAAKKLGADVKRI
ncbi:MAG: hypothetical protein JRN52_12330 [Nitrososphaerota archaeon]|nr:hypothetical protein [Nitrososphaerota archaeon]